VFVVGILKTLEEQMNFDVVGGFEIKRKENRHGLFDKKFWKKVRSSNEDVPNACGCYVFALKNGSNIVAWYVGKTEKLTFEKECFQATKINYYNEVLADHKGLPFLFLLPRLTGSGNKFSKPTISGYRDIEFLEKLLIGLALERNPLLTNIKNTKLLKEMKVPGVMNSPQSAPTLAVRDLRNALGLRHKT
jgi:hypothetical protein